MRILFSTVCVVAISATVPNPARSEADKFISQEDALGLITTVNVVVSDQVSDGCWTNANRVSAMIRLLFEQNGVVVEQEDLAFLTTAGRRVGVTVVGFRTSNGVCAASASFTVDHWVSQRIGGLDGLPQFSVSGMNRAVDESSIFTNGTSLDQQVLSFFEETTMNFISDIISARRSSSVAALKAAYPAFGESMMTRSEWDSYLSNLEK
jgi:hypothetical protein